MDMVAKARKKLGLEDPLPPELLAADNLTDLKVQIDPQKGNGGTLSSRPNPPSSSTAIAPSPAFFRPNIPLPPIAYRNAEMVSDNSAFKMSGGKSNTTTKKNKSSKSSKANQKSSSKQQDAEEGFVLKPSVPVAASISAQYKTKSKKKRYADDDEDLEGGARGGREEDSRAVFESEYEKKLKADYEQLKSQFNVMLAAATTTTTTIAIARSATDIQSEHDSPSLSVKSVTSSESPSTSQVPSMQRDEGGGGGAGGDDLSHVDKAEMNMVGDGSNGGGAVDR